MSERRTNYREWIAKAENDRICIQNNLAAQRIPWDVVCYHAQQVVEKLLKAFLVRHEQVPGKIHDVVALLRECVAIDSTLRELLGSCQIVLRYAADARYPEAMHDPDERDGQRAVESMERVRSALLQRLQGDEEQVS